MQSARGAGEPRIQRVELRCPEPGGRHVLRTREIYIVPVSDQCTTTRPPALQAGCLHHNSSHRPPGEANLISGNTGGAGYGLCITNPETADTAVLGNLVGTVITGTQALGNNFESLSI